MQEKLESLSNEMVQNGYPVIQDFQVNGLYQRFAIIGHKSQRELCIISQGKLNLSIWPVWFGMPARWKDEPPF